MSDVGEIDPQSDEILEFVRNLEPLTEFEPPASEEDLTAAERAIGLRLPDELRAFLRGSDGAFTATELTSGRVLSHANRLVWSAEEIARNHLQPLYPQPAEILVFADAGVDGILFGHPIRSDAQVGPEVLVWHPILDELDPAAPSFRAWIQAWLTDNLGV